MGGRWSGISVVLGEGGLVNTAGNWITDYGFQRDLEGGGDIYARLSCYKGWGRESGGVGGNGGVVYACFLGRSWCVVGVFGGRHEV